MLLLPNPEVTHGLATYLVNLQAITLTTSWPKGRPLFILSLVFMFEKGELQAYLVML